jgi:hypothetical protein
LRRKNQNLRKSQRRRLRDQTVRMMIVENILMN